MKRFNICVYSLALVAVLASCATRAPEPEPEAPPVVDPVARGKELLELPGLDGFSRFLNDPAAAPVLDELLTAFVQRQQSLVDSYLVRELPFEALHHLLNIGDQDFGEFHPAVEIADQFEAQGYGNLASEVRFSFLGIGESPSEKQGAEEQTAQALAQQFRPLVSAVHVKVWYETPDGVERYVYDSFSGTGIRLDERQVLTNYHVVEDAFWDDVERYEFWIELADERQVQAELVAWDTIADLAVLETVSEVPIAFSPLDRFSGHEEAQVGMSVVAFGNHSGLRGTLTSGVISSIDRRAPELGTWYQLDAGITGGASGGLVLGNEGQILGIVVAGIRSEDINFAIPAQTVRRSIDFLRAGRNVRNPWLGLMLDAKPETDAAGVEIRDIFPGSPLKEYGVEIGDRILAVGGQAVSTIAEAQAALLRQQAGNLTRVKLASAGGKERELFVFLPARPDFAAANGHRGFNRLETLYPEFDFSVDEEDSISIRSGSGDSVSELTFYLVSRVRPGSWMESVGVRAGDRVGIFEDRIRFGRRFLSLLHLPQGFEHPNDLHDPDDYILILERGLYNENIL